MREGARKQAAKENDGMRKEELDWGRGKRGRNFHLAMDE